MFESTFNLAYIPVINTISEQDQKRFFFWILLKYFIYISLPILIIAEVFMPQIIELVAPGFYNNDKFDIAVLTARIVLPYTLFVVTLSFLTAILNSNFYFSAAGSIHIIQNIITVIFLLSSIIFPILPILLIAISIVVSGFLQFLFLYYAIDKKWVFGVKAKFNYLKSIYSFFRLYFPSIIIYGLINLNIYIALFFASFSTGASSYLYYSERIAQITVAIIGLSFGTVLLPIFAKLVKENEFSEINNIFNDAYKYSLLFILPASIIFIFYSESIISFFFERGQFDLKSTKQTALFLKILGYGLIPNSLTLTLIPYFFVIKRVKKVFIFSVITIIFNIAMMNILILKIGISGIPLSITIASWVFFILLVGELFSQNANVGPNNFIKFSIKYFSFILISSFVSYLFFSTFDTQILNSTILSFLSIIVLGITYLILILVFDRKTITEIFFRLLSKKV